MTDGFKQERITRRQLLGAAASMGVVALGMGLLSGCSSRSGDSSSASSTSSAKQGEATSSSSSASSSSSSATSAQGAGKALVAVFSWSGNTLGVANRIVEDAQFELFRIEPVTAYTQDYNEMLQIAQDEQSQNAMPKIAGNVLNWDEYSTIYLGFPTWWGHLPQIVKSFLSEHDCAGKVVYPFNTHGGSGFASCLSDLAAVCPNADVREGLSLMGDSVQSSTSQIDDWVKKNA